MLPICSMGEISWCNALSKLNGSTRSRRYSPCSLSPTLPIIGGLFTIAPKCPTVDSDHQTASPIRFWVDTPSIALGCVGCVCGEIASSRLKPRFKFWMPTEYSFPLSPSNVLRGGNPRYGLGFTHTQTTFKLRTLTVGL